jgi:hypothetical protein
MLTAFRPRTTLREARIVVCRSVALAWLAVACGTKDASPDPEPGSGGAGAVSGASGAGAGGAGASSMGGVGGAAGSGAMSAGGSGASGRGGAGAAGAGAGASGAAGSGELPRPFWCPGYVESPSQSGWVSLKIVLPDGTSGGMSSPIQMCQASETAWSVTASGEEQDGVDMTTMAFSITGTYHGPGYYAGSLGEGISGSFSHSDFGTPVYASTADSDCELCINEDGLSGTVKCWALEAPREMGSAFAYVEAGQFACPGAQPKPADQPTVPPYVSAVGGVPPGGIVCHYLEKLNCPGHVDYETCARASDSEVLNGSCYGPWEAWLPCVNQLSPSEYRCGRDGKDLEMASGACATELAAVRACRDIASVRNSPECDALCDKAMAQCNAPCDRPIWCDPYEPHCAASKLEWLRCAVEGTAVTCGIDPPDTYVVLGCEYDDSVCQ